MLNMNVEALLKYLETNTYIDPYELTPKQELELLKITLSKNEFIGCGSSRIVFGLSPKTVIKISIDREGQNQSRTEIDMYKEFGDDYLARVMAHGKHVILMERVEILYDLSAIYRNIYFYLENEEDLAINFNMDIEMLHEVHAIFEFLGWELGETEDNNQIGFRLESGTPVCYDYGFVPENYSDCVSQTLSRKFFVDHKENTKTFLEEVVELL